VWRWLLRLLLIAVFAVGAVMTYNVLRARAALLRMVDTAATVNLDLLDNRAEADRLVRTFQQDAATAADSLANPLWDAATLLPAIGDDVAAVQIITRTFSDLSLTGLPQLVDAAITAHELRLDNLDLNNVSHALTQVQISDQALAAGITELQNIDQTGLLPELSELSTNLIIQLEELRRATAPIASIGELATAAQQLLPGLFG